MKKKTNTKLGCVFLIKVQQQNHTTIHIFDSKIIKKMDKNTPSSIELEMVCVFLTEMEKLRRKTK